MMAGFSNLEPQGDRDNVNRQGPQGEEQCGGWGGHEVISGKVPKTVLPDEFYRWRATFLTKGDKCNARTSIMKTPSTRHIV